MSPVVQSVASSATMQIQEIDAGHVRLVLDNANVVAAFLGGASLEVRFFAADEGDRLYFAFRAAREQSSEIDAFRIYARGDGKLRVAIKQDASRTWLQLDLKKTPKIRFVAIARATCGDFELQSDPQKIGTRSPARVSQISVVGRNARQTLLLISATDPDGLEDIRSLKLNLTLNGRPATVQVDVELHRITATWGDGQLCELVDVRASDIEYFTNIVRALVVLRLSPADVLAPEVSGEVDDHFSGVHQASYSLGPIENAPLLAEITPRYSSVSCRSNGTIWSKALDSRRGSFPNSAVMIKRATLPNERPLWMTEKQFSSRFSHKTYGPYALTSFPVTHIMWSYCHDLSGQRKYIPNVNSAISLGGLAYQPAADKGWVLEEIAALDFDLAPKVIPSWKVTFPSAREILSPVRPAYWELVRKRFSQFVDSGATSIQLDDYPNAGICVTFGGDFSAESMGGFSRWLGENTNALQRKRADLPECLEGFNYRDWLVERKNIRTAQQYMECIDKLKSTPVFRQYQWSVAVDAWRRIRQITDELSPDRHITLTSNGAPDWPAPEAYAYNSAIVDAMCAEIHLYPQRPCVDVAAITAYLMTDGLGVRLAAVPKGEENAFLTAVPCRDKRRAHVAESYAFGHQLMVPWGNWRKDVKRLFPAWEREYGVKYPEDRDQSFSSEAPDLLGPVYDFVQSKKHLLDGFSRYANVALLLRYRSLTVKTRHLVREMLRQHIQFTCIFADDTLHPRRLDAGLTSAFDHFVLADPMSEYTDPVTVENLSALAGKISPGASIPRPVWCSDENVFVTIMQKDGPAGRETTVHLLNRNYDARSGQIISAKLCRLRIARNLLPESGELAEVSSFGSASVVKAEPREEEIAIEVRDIDLWTVLHFR